MDCGTKQIDTTELNPQGLGEKEVANETPLGIIVERGSPLGNLKDRGNTSHTQKEVHYILVVEPTSQLNVGDDVAILRPIVMVEQQIVNTDEDSLFIDDTQVEVVVPETNHGLVQQDLDFLNSS